MKKIKILTCALVLLASSCSKDKVNTKETGSPFGNILSKLSGYDLNEEEQRIYDAMNAADSELAVIHNANLGIESSSGDYKFGGTISGSSSVDFGAIGQFQPNIGDYTYLYSNDDLSQLFDNVASLTVIEETDTHTVSFVVPDIILADRLDSGDLLLDREENHTLSWNADPTNNVTGRVAVLIRAYSTVKHEDGGSVYQENLILTEDDGALSISSYLSDPEITQVWISLARGNGELISMNDGDVLVNIRTIDHHIYSIE